MEKKFVDPNTLSTIFKSKSDLYKLMTVDCKEIGW